MDKYKQSLKYTRFRDYIPMKYRNKLNIGDKDGDDDDDDDDDKKWVLNYWSIVLYKCKSVWGYHNPQG